MVREPWVRVGIAAAYSFRGARGQAAVHEVAPARALEARLRSIRRPQLHEKEDTDMSTQPDNAPKKSNAYEMFIFVLTIFSLVVMVALLLPLNHATIGCSPFTTI